nr:uncharacterized protein LOC116773583 [Danaus plexippus plexippus]
MNTFVQFILIFILSSSRGDNYEPFHNFFNFMSIDIPALRDIPATADCVTAIVVLWTAIIMCQTLNPTLKHQEALDFQSWYWEVATDYIPLIEQIKDCKCPRVYIPVCGTDNKTYTNLCWLNCKNFIKNTNVRLYYVGLCLQFLEPLDY